MKVCHKYSNLIFFLILLLSSSYLHAQQSMIELWFDEGSGTTTLNNGYAGLNEPVLRSTAETGDGVSTGPVWSTDTPFNYENNHSLYFRGEKDNIDLGAGQSNNILPQNVTVEAWIKPEENTTADHAYIMLGRNDIGQIRFVFRLSKAEGQWQLLGYLYDEEGSPYRLDSELGAIVLDQWQHVAMTYDTTTGGKLYLNGTAVDSIASFGAMHTLDGYWTISHPTTLAFKGWIDEVRLSEFARVPGDGAGEGNTLAWNNTLYEQAPVFILSKGSLDFGTVTIGDTVVQDVDVKNGGNVNLEVDSVQSRHSQFRVITDTATIVPKTTHPFEIAYMPQTKHETLGEIVFFHNGDTSPDTLAVIGYGKAGLDTTDKIVSVQQDWGQVVFYQGFPRSLTLDHGSGQNLLPGLGDTRELGAVFFTWHDTLFSSAYDPAMTSSIEADTVTFTGVFHDTSATPAPDSIQYRIRWTVSTAGYLRGQFDISSPTGTRPTTLQYKFPFDGSRLNEYYYTGFQPASVRLNTSLKKVPMDRIGTIGEIFHFDEYVVNRVFGFINSEQEAINMVVDRGYIHEAILQNTPPAAVTYTDTTPSQYETIQSSFYLMPAPTRTRHQLRRIFTSVTEPVGIANSVEAFADTLEAYGFTEYVYLHRWRYWNFNDQSTELSWLASNPDQLHELVDELHQRGIKVFLYFNILPEEHSTVWYQNNNGAQYATEHPFNDRRDVMCLNTPFYEHRLDDANYRLDEFNTDGIYVDWYGIIGCTQSHPYHNHLPASNTEKLIEMIQYVHSKGKEIYIHGGEESRASYISELSDGLVSGERSWSRVNYQSTESGVFNRWTSNTGLFNVILDPRWGYSEAENRLEVNAALLEGLNPFGWTYRAYWYGIPSGVTGEFADSYPFQLLKTLQPFDIEALQYRVNLQGQVTSTDDRIGVSAFTGPDTTILGLINTDTTQTVSTTVTAMVGQLGLRTQEQYYVKNISKGELYGHWTADEIAGTGFEIQVPPNTTEFVTLTTEKPVAVGNQGNTPDIFSLQQNYPNPFNAQTTIEYSVPEQAKVTLRIYNLRGEVIKEIISEQQSPGEYTVQWNATGVPSGIYFYQLNTGDYSKTRKLVLIK